ncbi:MAG: hypothetical protein KatS3mg121_0605 [Gammaproteobacteria bacterium]|nr:MAG: hypothetical protein KatS3mg121_0605 [Gammaproteobacteria bacterium]
MQLKHAPRFRRGRLARRLAQAAGALLGGTAGAHAAEWRFDTALLYYSEADGRVSAAEPVVRASRVDEEGGRELNFKLVLDSLTGATPTGALPSSRPQTFSRPSGNGRYTVEAGAVPLDDTFHDTRWQLSGDWLEPLGRLDRVRLGLNLSNEYDFDSVGASAAWERDFNQRNTTLLLGLAFEADSIDPVGGVPEALQDVLPDPENDPAGPEARRARLDARPASASRDQLDLLVGVTQLLDPESFVQVNLSLSRSDGDHDDPYKMVSLVRTEAGPDQGEPVRNVYENRPDTRAKSALFLRYKRAFGRDVLDASYRYYRDDWGVVAHTIELRYDFTFASGAFLQPHLRLYRQQAADFYTSWLPVEATLPEYASADYRLGELSGTTIGVKYALPLDDRHTLEFRLERYVQSNDPVPGPPPGTPEGRRLILDTEATLFQVRYTF